MGHYLGNGSNITSRASSLLHQTKARSPCAFVPQSGSPVVPGSRGPAAQSPLDPLFPGDEGPPMSSDGNPSASGPPSVFISYASEDRAAARVLREALSNAGLDVWYDEDELTGGDAWDQKIRRQIRDCD